MSLLLILPSSLSLCHANVSLSDKHRMNNTISSWICLLLMYARMFLWVILLARDYYEWSRYSECYKFTPRDIWVSQCSLTLWGIKCHLRLYCRLTKLEPFACVIHERRRKTNYITCQQVFVSRGNTKTN